MSEGGVSSFGQRQKEIAAKVPEAEVPQDDAWRDDVLNRRELAEKLITFIDGQTQPLVISVDGAWGSGKTFVLERLEKSLKKKEFETIYFNAWEDDFHNDPLVALIGQIHKHFNASNRAIPRWNKVWNFSRNLFILILQPLLKRLLKSEEDIELNVEHLLKELQKNVKDLKEKKTDQVIEQYAESGKSKRALKDNLKILAQEYRKKKDQPLVFIVDELDRCRPTFAIELLERVKHIFDIENIVFILGINKEQLGKSIRSVYGEIDSDVYLRRFFDFDFSLPEADLEGFCKRLIELYNLESIFQNLGKAAETEDQFFQGDIKIFQDRMPKLFSLLDMSLRDLDEIIRSLVAIAKTCERDGRLLSYAVVPLLVIKQNNKSLYKELLRGQKPFIEAYDYIKDNMKIDSENIETPLLRSLQTVEAACYLLYPYEKQKEVLKQINKVVEQINESGNNAWDGVDTRLMSRDMQKRQDETEVLMVWTYIDMLLKRDQNHLNLQYIRKLISLA